MQNENKLSTNRLFFMYIGVFYKHVFLCLEMATTACGTLWRSIDCVYCIFNHVVWMSISRHYRGTKSQYNIATLEDSTFFIIIIVPSTQSLSSVNTINPLVAFCDPLFVFFGIPILHCNVTWCWLLQCMYCIFNHVVWMSISRHYRGTKS
jgi:hypothetical protein